jgi:hypothetical protein
MRIPSFFIVGAPKSGTTALNHYLKQHPEIFVPDMKDVSFFGSDLCFTGERITKEQYIGAFSRANGERQVGESSVWYLYSKRAAAEIKRFSPGARIIAMLRNPVDMLYAQHSTFLYNCNEDIVDFEQALNVEEARKRGMRIPKTAHFVAGLFYRETVKYVEQVKRYFDVFSRENVHIIIYDDFKTDTDGAFKQTLQFLGVNPNFQVEPEIINSNKVVLNRRVQEFLVAPPPFLVSAYVAIMPRSLQGRFIRRLRYANARHTQRSPLDPDTRQRLQAEFSPEVERLSELLGRDLMFWCGARNTAL